MKLGLVGDIGGTNARFALWRNECLESVQVLPTAGYAGPEEAIGAYLASLDLDPQAVDAVCLACAGPVVSEPFRFTNNHWRLERAAFCRALGLRDLLLINDFTAMALGMTRLQDGEQRLVRPGTAQIGSPCMVIGPGTGLGVASLLPLGDGRWKALPGEGGHVDLPLATLQEAELWQILLDMLGHVRAEDVLSGAGLLTLYRAFSRLSGSPAQLQSPAEVTTAALSGEPLALAVLEQFCVWLGRVAGNNVLTLGALGGVYVVGGVVPRFADFFAVSGFSRSFVEKGCMSHYLDEVPVWLVTAEYPGLTGAGVALQQAFSG
ncbi:glucokinase [Pseudomonas sp. NCCP-436]|uniref:glucokinase n=1 Tax=Pseudomonas sp. NCCP-436 TaxID=2842481 RepID=UPI001C81AC12|nr:glucokinase [Pseudomonas sp. NCCP-436]GIZ11887.1 glucokinase [Pseudomonas sp. NCCP-436]